MRRGIRLAVLGSVALLAGCGGIGGTGQTYDYSGVLTHPTALPNGELPTIEAWRCDGGDCALAIAIGDAGYFVTCDRLAPDVRTGERVATSAGDSYGDAFAVVGYPGVLALVVRQCDHGFPSVAFEFAIRDASDRDLVRSRFAMECEVFAAPSRDCSGETPLAIRSDNSTYYEYQPSYVASVDASIASTGVHWRLDRDSVVRRWLGPDISKCPGFGDWSYGCRRAGTWDGDEYELLSLHLIESTPDPFLDRSVERHVVSEMGQSRAWYVVESRYGLAEPLDVHGTEAVRLWDELWVGCCDDVYIDVTEYPRTQPTTSTLSPTDRSTTTFAPTDDSSSPGG